MTHEDELWNLAFSNVGRLHGKPENRRDVSRAVQAISGVAPPTNQQRQIMTVTGMYQYNLGAKMLTRRRRREGSPTSCLCFPVRQWYRFRFKAVSTVHRNISKFKFPLCQCTPELEGSRSRRYRCQQRPTVQLSSISWYSGSASAPLVWRRSTMEAGQMTVRSGQTGGRQTQRTTISQLS